MKRILLSIILLLIIICFNSVKINNKKIKDYFFDSINIMKITNLFKTKKEIPVSLDFNEILLLEMTPFLDGALIKTDTNQVKSMINGSVIYVGYLDYYGDSVIIKGLDGHEYHYGFFDKITVKMYEEVNKEVIIGEISLDHDMLNYIYYLAIKGYNLE